jgi:hypothetical protein
MPKPRPAKNAADLVATAPPGEPELPLTEAAPELVPASIPDIDAVVAILRVSDLGTACRRLGAACPQLTLEERIVLLRAASKVIQEGWLASDARKAREKLASRCPISQIEPS